MDYKETIDMINVLLVEDDDTITFGIRTALAKSGYDVTCCQSIEEGKQAFSHDVRLILLDLNLPDGNGYDFCRWVKDITDVPVIFLTVRDDAADITKGLDMGGDDYITKPFHIPVLISRIRAVLRRIPEDSGTLLTCGDITLDKTSMAVTTNGCEVLLSALEYRLLTILMENKGRILPRNLILEKLWDCEGSFVNDNTLTVTVKRLREKLKDTKHIVTARGIGYRMEEQI